MAHTLQGDTVADIVKIENDDGSSDYLNLDQVVSVHVERRPAGQAHRVQVLTFDGTETEYRAGEAGQLINILRQNSGEEQ